MRNGIGPTSIFQFIYPSIDLSGSLCALLLKKKWRWMTLVIHFHCVPGVYWNSCFFLFLSWISSWIHDKLLEMWCLALCVSLVPRNINAKWENWYSPGQIRWNFPTSADEQPVLTQFYTMNRSYLRWQKKGCLCGPPSAFGISVRVSLEFSSP